MKHAGVAITMTSVTDLLAFGIGSSSTLLALSSFCVYAVWHQDSSFYPLKEISSPSTNEWPNSLGYVCEIPTPGRSILVQLLPIYWPFLHYRQLGSSVCSFTWSLSSWPFSPLTSEGLTARGTDLFVAGRRLMIGRQTNVRRYANLVSDILDFFYMTEKNYHSMWCFSDVAN